MSNLQYADGKKHHTQFMISKFASLKSRLPLSSYRHTFELKTRKSTIFSTKLVKATSKRLIAEKSTAFSSKFLKATSKSGLSLQYMN
jgi:hypothetical protein